MALEDVVIPQEALEYLPKNASFPRISDEMIASLALGLEDDLIVAARHGLSVQDFTELQAQPWFQLQIQVKRSEFEKNGVTFKAKAAWMAGELLDQVYLQVASPEANVGQKHEVLKTLIKAAGLEPKEEKSTSSLPTFQINIDLGDQSVSLSASAESKPAPMVIDADVKQIT